MGNAQGSGSARNEPLEAYMREQQRDEQLRNLGLKRSKSLRKSISKRLRHKKNANNENEISNNDNNDTHKEARKESSEEGRPRLARSTPEPMPTHVNQDLDGQPRRMERLRRSLRSSLRRKKRENVDTPDARPAPTPSRPSETPSSTSTPSKRSGRKPQLWLLDETEVRNGTCRFVVKYLGCVEVFESRGMNVCEEAVKVLKNSKRKSVRAIFYVSGDGLRVVDEDTKGLIVDQTIEKVSFCAPDRNYERGFSYICRDGTTRRWMCHGFMAVRDSGERLSHAVGCAFAICLEKKQQRDKVTVSMSFDENSAAFTRHGSFRQASLTERIFDPQGIKPSQDKPPVENQVDNPWAVQRPRATELMLQRQTSFRGFNQLQASGNSPFKRQLSLRLSELPSNLERQQEPAEKQLPHSTLLEELESVETVVQTSSGPATDLKARIFQLYRSSEAGPSKAGVLEPTVVTSDGESSEPTSGPTTDEPERNDAISTMCRELTQELSLLSNDEDAPVGLENQAGPQARAMPICQLQETYSLTFNALHSLSPLPTLAESAAENNAEGANNDDDEETIAHDQPIPHNPWDLVPDQPNHGPASTVPSVSNNMKTVSCDSSSGVSSNSANAFSEEEPSRQVESAATAESSSPLELWPNKSSRILDDPFDAEWAALAARNASVNNSNPFRSANSSNGGTAASGHFKAFELSM